MGTYSKVNDWLEYLVKNANLDTDTFRIALSNTAPQDEVLNPLDDGNGVLANVTQISYLNYSDDLNTPRTLDNVTATYEGGALTFTASNFEIVASGGDIADFRYIYVYDDTIAGDPLVAVWDLMFNVGLLENDSLRVNFDVRGIFKVE
jgi:hypothetical protein